MSNSVRRTNSVSSRLKPIKHNVYLAPDEWIYVTENDSRIQISEDGGRAGAACKQTPRQSVDTPRQSIDTPQRSIDTPRRSIATPRRSIDGLHIPKKEFASTKHLPKSCSECKTSLKDWDSGEDDVFEFGHKKKQHREKDYEESKIVHWRLRKEQTEVEELNQKHLGMMRVLHRRKLALDAIRLKLKLEGFNGLVLWLIAANDDTLIVDLLPLLCDQLQKDTKDANSISPTLALMLIPSMMSLLSTRFEEYMSKALDFIEVCLCDTLPTNCTFYHSWIMELLDLLISLQNDSDKMSRCSYDTCFKLQNCLQLLQHRIASQ